MPSECVGAMSLLRDTRINRMIFKHTAMPALTTSSIIKPTQLQNLSKIRARLSWACEQPAVPPIEPSYVFRHAESNSCPSPQTHKKNIVYKRFSKKTPGILQGNFQNESIPIDRPKKIDPSSPLIGQGTNEVAFRQGTHSFQLFTLTKVLEHGGPQRREDTTTAGPGVAHQLLQNIEVRGIRYSFSHLLKDPAAMHFLLASPF